MEPSQIGRHEVLAVLKQVGEDCPRKMRVYLIGGGAMALRREKDSTRDLDLVMESQRNADDIKKAFERIGFIVAARRPEECHALVDAAILSKPAGLRADIFVGKVCNLLCFSDGMKRRSALVGEFGKVSLFMSSREDIFLLKSVTERARDLDDMMSLFRRGLDENVILEECERQTKLAGFRSSQVWEAFLVVKIEEMEKRYGIRIPWKRALRSRAEVKMCSLQLLKEMDKGILSITELSKAIGESIEFTRRCISYLKDIGEIPTQSKRKPDGSQPRRRRS